MREGDIISIDGSEGTVVLGAVPLTAAEAPPELTKLLGWADDVRAGRLGVRANADTGDDAANARHLGAEGIGLCRTEHMFFGDDRLPIMRRMILASTEEEAARRPRGAEGGAEGGLPRHPRGDGRPARHRPWARPAAARVPSRRRVAPRQAGQGGPQREEEKLLEAAKAWREANPMIGVRGVRLGVLKPGLYAMQVRALMEAAYERAAAGGHPVVEIMIPLTVSAEEMELARSWVVQALEDAAPAGGAGAAAERIEVAIGTMIETPRAALLADQIAEDADFFSFGTNDLTQMTFGFSRDDVEGRMMAAYLSQGLLKANPFENVDTEGVGELVRIAVERGRAARPGIKIGVCGEHGGDPASIDFFANAGLDYVSCSPFRVPIARLAAAYAVLAIDAKKAQQASA